ncbi:MAG: sugar phosphate isomerase/epimerase [Bacteroidetes bacterium]|nr:sugar phosphate isomerase/epimerase [Bacteroidota bacterium]MCH8233006.1 sugar phosphate isomerase/epimerase [Bacteroidota bacterium]
MLGMYGCSESGKKDDASQEETTAEAASASELFFKISLAEWSLHKALFADEMTNLDFPVMAKKDFGIDAVEYVNIFFKDKAEDAAYLSQLNTICSDNGVSNVLIMCDGEGNLGDADEAKRIEAVENHYKWVEAAKTLGCHSIRVNARGTGTAEEVAAAAIDGLGRLSEFAKDFDINVIVENHGGVSSDGKWLSNVISLVGMANCGTLPDFGNFCIESGEDGCIKEYDRYLGVKELMPFAKGVSAKSHDFDENGNETHTDYTKMLKIVKEAGYRGHIGIEYEGAEDPENVGIMKTKALLEKVGAMV